MEKYKMKEMQKEEIKQEIRMLREVSFKISQDSSKKGGKHVESRTCVDLKRLEKMYPKLFKDAIREDIEDLRVAITKHDKLYSQSQPMITDLSYDRLYLRLEKLEKDYPEFYDANSPTQRIIATVVDSLEKVKHTEPMLSQQKINSKEEVIEFVRKANGGILVQEKLDGITIVLRYRDGKLTEAITRGNGEVGENLYHNVVHFKNVPKKIEFKGELEVRAEAVLPFEKFEEMNKEGEYSNPRNLVSGSLRQLDSSKVKGRGFKAIIFDLIVAEDKNFDTDSQRIEFMEQVGFEVINSTLLNSSSPEEVFEFIERYENETRETLEHMIDGMVLKYDNLELREELGYTSKSPRWATAYKFKSMDAITKLIGITNQVGKTGQITPVAELETVEIDGVDIRRATLHNYGNIADKDIRVGDMVIVERANDVIPQIVKSIKEKRDGSEIIKNPPMLCPICSSSTSFKGANLYCTGIDCTPQIEGKIKHFVSRDAMDISGLGEKTVEMFFNEGIIESITDIYKLKDKKEEILKLEGFGEKKYERIIKGVENSKNREFENLIYGLCIENIGRSASRDLANEFKSMENILIDSKNEKRFEEKLLGIEAFGEIMSQNIVSFFSNSLNIAIINELQSLGLTTELKEERIEINNSKIQNMTFVITGKLNRFKNRKEMQEEIEKLGGKVVGSVSGNTDYLVNNDIESTSSKNKQAKKRDIPIISEDEFLSLIK